MPRSCSAAARRTSSCQFVLPPSTIVSPWSMRSASASTVCSVGSPAGTMTHTVRGGSSLETSSSRLETPVAPWPSAALTASSLKSKATTWLSESRWMRWTMLPPILPSPMNPSCIRGSPSRRARLAGDRQVGRRLVDDLDEPAGRWAALVELACRVQVARAVAERGGHAVVGDEPLAETRDRRVGLLAVREVAEDRHVAGRRRVGQQLVEVARVERARSFLEHAVRVVLGL